MSTAQRYMDLFRGNDRAHGVFNVSSGARERDGKKQGIALVRKEPTTLQHWEDHLEGRNGLGVIPIRDDNTCLFGAIDLDNYDMDHRALLRKLRKDAIPAVVCRSKSGGAHLYFFFTEAILAEDLQPKLNEIAAFLGHGGSEVFPKQTRILVDRGDTGNFINMPYHAGDRTVRYGFDDQGDSLTMVDFLDYAEAHRLSPDAFLDLKTSRENRSSPLPDGPPCLQHLAALGFGEGGRNNALFNLGVYARMADPDNWESLLAKYNAEYMVPPLSHQEVGGVIKQLNKKEYFYTCDKPPIASFCNKELCLGRKFGVGPGRANNTLSSLTKIDGDPPIWILNVDGERVELSTDALVSQPKFQRECVAQINKYPIPVNPKVWQTKMQELLDNLTVVEVPPDATNEGIFNELLKSFCCDRAKGHDREDILSGIAVWTEDRVFFQVKDVRKHLEVNGFEHYNSTKMIQHLQENLKAKAMFWRLPGGKGVHVWSLPEEFFEVEGTTGREVRPVPPSKKDII